MFGSLSLLRRGLLEESSREAKPLLPTNSPCPCIGEGGQRGMGFPNNGGVTTSRQEL